MAVEYATTYYVIEYVSGYWSDERETANRSFYRLTTYSRLRGREDGREYYEVGILPSNLEAARKAADSGDVVLYNDSRFEERA